MQQRPTPPRRSDRSALVRYAAAWLIAGGLIVVAVLTFTGDDPSVTIDPVRETRLDRAAMTAGCTLVRGESEGLEPPASGPDGRPARTGTYEGPLSRSAQIGALRRGVVIISYRPGAAEVDADELAVLQEAVPAGTIVAPNERMTHAVAVAAWQRRLACPSMGDGVLDAVQLFRGRYIGSGPDVAP
jgi:Protein of unknown function (DUF3105)